MTSPTSSGNSPPGATPSAPWAAHDVRDHRTGTKLLTHPVVGDLDLDYEAMDLTSDRGTQLITYTARPGSPSHDALRLLSSWLATGPTSHQRTPQP